VSGERVSQTERQERTRYALLATAQDLLESNSLDLPISKICLRAGVAVGSFYNYFESRNELFDAAAIQVLIDYHPKLQQIVSRFDDPGQGIVASFRHMAHLASIDPRKAKIIVNAGTGAFTNYAEYAEPVINALRVSVSRGLAKCDDINGFLVAFGGAYQNILAFSLRDPNFDASQADRGIAIFANALGYPKEVIDRLCFGPVELP
jgi:AcrR family transcriptional regulator